MKDSKVFIDPKYKTLGSKAIKQYPQLKDMSVEQAAEFIREKAYKGLDKFRDEQGLGNKIIIDPRKLAERKAHATSHAEGITVAPFEGRDQEEQLGYLMHEYGHQLDDAAKLYGKLQDEYEDTKWTNPIGKLLKYKKLNDVKEAAEQMRKNYPSGKMDKFLDSPFIKEYESAPSNPLLEKDRPHHFERDFRNDNLKNIERGGLEEVVQDTSNFRNLLEKLRSRA